MLTELLPQNLGKLGLLRRVPAPKADLLTIWDTSYPVIRPYQELCREFEFLRAFGGGGMLDQKTQYPGYITSGYRSELIGNNVHSMHRYALAIDVAIGVVERQIQVANVARNYFERIGFYPDRGFIHLDQCPVQLMRKLNKTRFWVITKESSRAFNDYEQAVAEALKFAAS